MQQHINAQVYHLKFTPTRTTSQKRSKKGLLEIRHKRYPFSAFERIEQPKQSAIAVVTFHPQTSLAATRYELQPKDDLYRAKVLLNGIGSKADAFDPSQEQVETGGYENVGCASERGRRDRFGRFTRLIDLYAFSS